MVKPGKVYLVGAGPGDPGLLTLKARELLSRCDAVVYDALVHPALLDFVPSKAHKIFRGNRGRKGALKQARLNDLLVSLARQGKMVVRLKGGDPFVFGRGGEEALALVEAGIPFEVVPGVTSAVAVAAYAGIPVTHRGINTSFTVVTGHEDASRDESRIDWGHLAQDQGTLVFLMGLHTLPLVCANLVRHGKPAHTPAAVIQSGTTSRQKKVLGDLGSLPSLVKRAGLKPPAILVVGGVVGLSDELDWTRQKPLFGTKVLVTRTRSQASYLSGLLQNEGAEVIEIPTLEIVPLPLNLQGRKWLRDIGSFDWLVFSSANAVEIFMERALQAGVNFEQLHKVRIACVGPSTAKALKPFGLKAHLVPKDYKQEGLVKAFKELSVKGKRILFARAKEGREILSDSLKRQGAKLQEWALYENRVPKEARPKVQRLFGEEGGVDILLFASSSSADHFYGLFTSAQRKKWLKAVPVAAIGPVTAASARQWGVKVAVQPETYTMEALVSALVQWARKRAQGPSKGL